MIKNTLSLMVRNFQRNIVFSTITLGSLVLGITLAILTFIWIQYELKYNHSISDSDRVFALLINDELEGEIQTNEGTQYPLFDFLTKETPAVVAASRIDNTRAMISIDGKSIQRKGIYGDPSFFKVYLPDRSPQLEVSLKYPGSIVISESLSKDLFGTETSIGKSIILEKNRTFIIGGVFENFPSNTDFHYIDFILPWMARPTDADEWVSYSIKLRDSKYKDQVEQLIDQQIQVQEPGSKSTSLLFAVSDWRLHWNFENGQPSGGRISYLVMFGLASGLILIMSCVNYVNIATARAMKRAREIGVRKVTGATQFALLKQFMTESYITTSLAVAISLLITSLLMPIFSDLVGVSLELPLTEPVFLGGLLLLTLGTTLISGWYPALYLTSFQPAIVLKVGYHSKASGSLFRNGLVVFQFGISVVLIFSALTFWRQTDFLLKKDLGYDKERVINVWLADINIPHDQLKAKVLEHSSIEAAGVSGASPMEINGYAECNRVTSPLSSPLPFFGANIDEDVLSVLKFKLISGRNFQFASDSNNFVITQTAARLLGIEQAAGQRITYNMFTPQEGEVIGIINDFQNDDVHIAPKPVVLSFGKPRYFANLFVRYQDGQLEEALGHLRAVFTEVSPGVPLDFSFLDSDFETQLYREKFLKEVSLYFTFIAIAIACLGLFGLIVFNTERKTKEIGIRKVLGATSGQIIWLMFSAIVPGIVYSLFLGLPIAGYLMSLYLEEYPSRISLSTSLYGSVGAVVMLLVFATISYHSIRASRQKSVDALKIE